MAVDIRKVKDLHGLVEYFAAKLGWNIDFDDFEDIEDITYDFDASDIGLKEEAFAKISALQQLPPLVDGQRWGIFSVEFDSKRFEVTALRKILSGLIPKRRNAANHAVWDQQDLLFLCFWGEGNERTIGVAHFADQEAGLPQIRMIYCAPAVEDFTQIMRFEERLSRLQWPDDTSDKERWREEWSGAFRYAYRQTITDSSTLTHQLAVEAQDIRDRIMEALDVEAPNGYVHTLYDKFKNTLIHDMTEQQFADMYAQTVVYGLFSARCMDETQEDFSAAEAVECIPNTNPFLKHLMQECLGAQANSRLSFDELEIGDVVELLRHTQTEAIIQDFNRQTGGGREDPVIHFYEEFLTAYDKAQKVQRGVFYTPQPAVNFIVRAVDELLKSEFGVTEGLASTGTKKIRIQRDSKKRVDGFIRKVEDTIDVPAVQVLDPSTGTGTFLRQVILQIFSNYQDMVRAGKANKEGWNSYVEEHLLPRLNGFELMMAPYAVAHMKLAMVLKDTGYNFESDARLNLFLTNTLEKPGSSETQLALWDDPLATESIEANGVKKNKGINVILGNPPYSGISSNNGAWITELIEDYKYIEGVHFGERKHWLQDDYVKFIRFSEYVLSESGSGILAFINNHAFIDNPTFRCMRYHLLQTFDEIFIIDLHGNVMRHEVSPDGERDENVFDIQQGVSINIFVKHGKKGDDLAKVYHAELFGRREHKYAVLSAISLKDMRWQQLEPNDPFYFYIPRNEHHRDEYEKGFSIQELMPEHTTGVVTARDGLVINQSKEQLTAQIEAFTDPTKSDDEIRQMFFGNKRAGKYLPGDSRGWSLSKARRLIRKNDHMDMIQKIAYRPFDTQYIYYSPDMVDWGREKLMCHLLKEDNYGLIIPRQAATDNWSHVQVTRYMADNRIHYSNKGIPIVCPLYLYTDKTLGGLSRTPNLDATIISKIAGSIGLTFIPEDTKVGENEFGPLDVLDYIYAVLHSPQFREKYAEFLKFDFPKIPYPVNYEYFTKLKQLGQRLRILHTDESEPISTANEYQGQQNPIVDRPAYKKGCICLNPSGDRIINVPEHIWNMYFGGYQPLQKWLKDRRGKVLTQADVHHLQYMVFALTETYEIMREIDVAINP